MTKTLRELTGWGGVRLSRAQIQKSAEHGIEIGGISLPKGLAMRIHEVVAKMGWCQDIECPCFQHGAQAEWEQNHEH